MQHNVPEIDLVEGICRAWQVDSICERFVSDWEKGRRPSIDGVLEDALLEQQDLLIPELVRLELEYRRRAGEAIELADYVSRYPKYSDEIRAIFDGIEKPGTVSIAEPNQATSRVNQGSGQIHCPLCQNSIELVDQAPQRDTECAPSETRSIPSGDDTVTGQTPDGRRLVPRRIGHFELTEQLGQGTFGTVWKARDEHLDRTVAVKIPRKGALSQEENEKFLREARAAGQLSHPNIVSVHEVGIDEGVLFIVSDLVSGVTLSDWLTGQRPPPRQAAELCLRIAEALHYAHEMGVVHRDLKPSNIMIDGVGNPHLMDFGLAKRESGETTVTVDGQILGTPAYMSPEQAKGEGHEADRRSDVYSLGVVLFQLLTGELPFRGNFHMLLQQVVEDEPPGLRRLDNRIPRDLETICLKCLEKAPEKRYSSAEDLAAELDRFLAGKPIEARPVGPFEQMWRWYSRRADSSAQVAGLYTTLCAILLIAWAFEGIFVYATGLDPSPDWATAILEIAILLVAVYTPLLVSGILVIKGSRGTLWLGFALFVVGFLSALAGITGVVTFSGVFGDPRLRIAILMLLLNLTFVGVVLHIAALLAQIVSRDK